MNLPDQRGGKRPLERPRDRAQRLLLGALWALKPPRLWSLPALFYVLARHYLRSGSRRGELPTPAEALTGGITGVCSSLDVATLLEGYARGLFPFSHVGPEKWMAPEQRMVLFPEDFVIEKNLRRKIRNRHFKVTFDEDFEGVIRGCAELRPGRYPLTWIKPAIIDAYLDLFEAGHAHSVEVWDGDGRLVGGAYGVAIGRVFFTESQFNRVRDAAKVGFAVLNCHLQHWGYVLNDGKHYTRHLERLGFRLIPRDAFNALLGQNTQIPGKPRYQALGPTGRWRLDPALDPGNWDPKAAAEAVPG